MKIACDCTVINRNVPHMKNRCVKATLAIGKHPPNSEDSKYYVLFFSAIHKTGQRYLIYQNIIKLYTRFIAEGKATISFKVPELDFLIQSDATQLKAFVQCLRYIMDEKKSKIDKIQLPSVMTITKSDATQKKLVIRSRGDYPIKGFPKTIINLQINGIKLNRVDSQVFRLKDLTHLDLSDNQIERIPTQLGNFRIQVLNLSQNNLGNNDLKWTWLQGKEISMSLHYLNISENKISHFPYSLAISKNISYLDMSGNNLVTVPFSIRGMRGLRNLNLSKNSLSSVPNSLLQMRLNSLNLSSNNMTDAQLPMLQMSYYDNKICQPSCLLSLAGRIVMKRNVPYSKCTIPSILVDTLDHGNCCHCGNLDTEAEVFMQIAHVEVQRNVETIILDRRIRILTDQVFCSRRCFARLVGARLEDRTVQ